VRGVIVGCIYLPGNPQPGPKFAYKLAWFERLIAHAATLLEAGVPVVLAGDYNVVPTDRDIYATHSYPGNALLQPEPREAYRRLLNQGWTDSLREMHPEVPMFTFWNYKRERRSRDAGLRLDHLLVSPDLTQRLADAGVDRWVRGEADASDHAPAWIELRETSRSTATAPQACGAIGRARRAAFETPPIGRPMPPHVNTPAQGKRCPRNGSGQLQSSTRSSIILRSPRSWGRPSAWRSGTFACGFASPKRPGTKTVMCCQRTSSC